MNEQAKKEIARRTEVIASKFKYKRNKLTIKEMEEDVNWILEDLKQPAKPNHAWSKQTVGGGVWI